jgi:hypothetical protein
MVNEYWYISWWAIFMYLDKHAHNSAKKIIWNCLTSWADIDFFKPLSEIQDYKEEVIQVRPNIVKVLTQINNNSVIASFTFIKKKD